MKLDDFPTCALDLVEIVEAEEVLQAILLTEDTMDLWPTVPSSSSDESGSVSRFKVKSSNSMLHSTGGDDDGVSGRSCAGGGSGRSCAGGASGRSCVGGVSGRSGVGRAIGCNTGGKRGGGVLSPCDTGSQAAPTNPGCNMFIFTHSGVGVSITSSPPDSRLLGLTRGTEGSTVRCESPSGQTRSDSVVAGVEYECSRTIRSSCSWEITWVWAPLGYLGVPSPPLLQRTTLEPWCSREVDMVLPGMLVGATSISGNK